MSYYWVSAEYKVVELDDALYAEWQQSNNPKADYYTPIAAKPSSDAYYNGISWVVPPAEIPQVVSRFQAKAALLQAGYLATIEALVAQSDAFTQLAWNEAVEFRRDSPLLNQLAVALALTSEQVDALFVVAAGINA